MSDQTEQQQKQDALKFKASDSRIAELLTESNNLIDKSRNNVSGWRKKIVNALERRKGLRGKHHRHIPFEHSSDLRFRLEEVILRELNTAFTQVVQNAPKLARFIPLDPKDAQHADDLEYYVQWQLMGEDNHFREKIKLLANKRNECVAVAKIIWDRRTESKTCTYTRTEFGEKLAPFYAKRITALIMAQQQGEEVDPSLVDLSSEEVSAAVADIYGWDRKKDIYRKRCDRVAEQWKGKGDIISVIEDELVMNRPNIIPVTDFDDWGLPENANRTMINDADWVYHDRDFTERELLDARDRFDNVDLLLDKIKSAVRNAETSTYKMMIERGARLTSTGLMEGFITIRELCRWVPRSDIARFNGLTEDDDTPVRAVITYCPHVPPEEVPPLRLMEYGYQHGSWPYECDSFNFTEDLFYSAEGVGMLLEPYSEEYDRSRNAAIDRETITLSPPIIVWSEAKLNTQSFRQVGQVMQSRLPVNDGIINMPRYPDLSSKLEMTADAMKGHAMQIAGVPGAHTLPPYSDAPSAQQVQQAAAPVNALLTDQLSDWTDFLGRVLRQVHALNKQFLFLDKKQSDKISVPKMGGQPGETVVITPDHFRGKYNIVCGADTARSNPMFEAQRLMAWQQSFANDPRWAPFIQPFEVAQLVTNKMIGYIDAQTVLQDKTKADQLNQQFLQMQAQAKAAMEMQKQKSQARGRQPKGSPGGLKEMAGAQQGIFPKSVGT